MQQPGKIKTYGFGFRSWSIDRKTTTSMKQNVMLADVDQQIVYSRCNKCLNANSRGETLDGRHRRCLVKRMPEQAKGISEHFKEHVGAYVCVMQNEK